MRENMGLYHGKRIYNGEWLEGSLLFYPDVNRAFISSGDYHRIGGIVEVDKKTVGQYTGKTDRNHKKVFEHDVLQMYTIWADGRCEKARIVVVLFSVNDQAYVLCNSNNIHDMYDDFGNYGRSEYYEKIGNIHDNPELLEVSGDA